MCFLNFGKTSAAVDELRAKITENLQQISESISDMFQDQELQKHETIDALSKLAQTMERLEEREAIINSTLREMESMRQEHGSQDVKIQNMILTSERDTLLDGLESTRSQLTDAKRAEESYREKFADTKTSLKVLQARFDTQCIALELAEKSVSEARVIFRFLCRFVLSLPILWEPPHSTILTPKKIYNESISHVNVLEERERSLQRGLDEANSATAAERDFVCSLQKKLSDCQKDLPQLQDIQRVVEQIAEQRPHDTELQIQELKREIGSQHGELCDKDEVILKLTQTTLDQDPQLLQRSMNITVCHKQRDLNDDEWTLVKSLAEEATKVFGCTIAEKDNNIRIRNDLIETLQARVRGLEASLANRIGASPSGSSRDSKQDESPCNDPPYEPPTARTTSALGSRVPAKRMNSLDEDSVRPANRPVPGKSIQQKYERGKVHMDCFFFLSFDSSWVNRMLVLQVPYSTFANNDELSAPAPSSAR
ncbi:uncharacterized protein HD556DRAFT_1311881 [Suillus plorans]|uniref:Uncharacterized protein n=1 Tax=Suillus plorans TaxID=116603 RepID=A0A9P7DDP4_9AGAM|nr:uncharacterized protein HD556DRAFT_1311881 [Suillus plorans]KAG1788619.1 hypothetical protein HD556DRAFT_1311881 [Suillus plorans]